MGWPATHSGPTLDTRAHAPPTYSEIFDLCDGNPCVQPKGFFLPRGGGCFMPLMRALVFNKLSVPCAILADVRGWQEPPALHTKCRHAGPTEHTYTDPRGKARRQTLCPFPGVANARDRAAMQLGAPRGCATGHWEQHANERNVTMGLGSAPLVRVSFQPTPQSLTDDGG